MSSRYRSQAHPSPPVLSPAFAEADPRRQAPGEREQDAGHAFQRKSYRLEKNSSVLRQKSLYFECHSGLDPESNDFNWIPAFAGMTASELM